MQVLHIFFSVNIYYHSLPWVNILIIYAVRIFFAVNIEYPSMEKEYKKKHDLRLKRTVLLFDHKSLIQAI